MPTYDIICQKCGHKFSETRSMSEGPPKKCESCKSSKVFQDFGGKAPGFKFTGYSPMHPRNFRGRGSQPTSFGDLN